MYSTTYCCDFFLWNEVRKTKPSCKPENWTLARINLHSFNNILSRFSGTRKSNKNLILTITVHHFTKNLHSLPYLYWHYKLVLRLAGVFGFLQMALLLNKFVHPWFILCVKKHEWERSIAANKTHFLQLILPLKVRKCAIPPEHLRSEISSCTFATFQ